MLTYVFYDRAVLDTDFAKLAALIEEAAPSRAWVSIERTDTGFVITCDLSAAPAVQSAVAAMGWRQACSVTF